MKQLILENIRSAYNVGAIFRTADGAGIEKIWLVGYTPSPRDRFGRVQREIEKTSLGASETVAWEKADSVTAVIEQLRQISYTITAVEITPEASSLLSYEVPEKVAYILGNEVEGVSAAALAAADQVVYLPMRGQKESLNVSVTAGIVMYHE